MQEGIPARVSVVIVPRERFSCALESLDSIIEHTRDLPGIDLEIVYVDGNSPPSAARGLDQRVQAHDITRVRTRHYLSPNQARNLGLRHAHGDWIVFCDNDVIVTPGWLQRMLECARATGAWVVTPLTCEGTPLHQTVHCAGGQAAIEERTGADGRRERVIVERMFLQKRKVDVVLPTLSRCETSLAEYHCLLIRRSALDRIGPLDEGFMNTKEHIDLCLSVRQAGGSIWFEPAAIVTYLFDRPLAASDIAYFMLRWSDAWEERSLRHFMRKWDLAHDAYFENRLANRGWRRHLAIWRPVARRLSFGRRNKVLSRALFTLDRPFNRWLTASHGRQASTAQPPAVHVSRGSRIDRASATPTT